MRKICLIALLMAGLGATFFIETLAVAAETPRITKEQLKTMRGDPNVVVIDVRIDRHWNGSDSKIKGAVRESPGTQADAWMAKYPKVKTIVFYDQ